MYSSGISAPGGPKVAYAENQSTSSAPHWLVTIAGKQVHVSRAQLTINAHGATNEGTITASLLADGDWSTILNKNVPDLVAANGTLLPGVTLPTQSTYIDPKLDRPIPISIDAGFTSDAGIASAKQLTRLFLGLVDSYRAGFRSGEIEFTVRSLAAVLIQDKIQTSVENMSTVAFIRESATRWGLTTDIQLRSGQQPETLQAVYAQRELVGIRNLRRWDLAKYCAQVDDVQLWETNGVIHYVQPGAVKRITANLVHGRDFLDITGTHAVQFNKDIEVEVHSYTRRTRESKWSRTTANNGLGQTTTSGSSIVSSAADFGDSGSTSTSTDANGNTRTTKSTSSGGSATSGITGTGYTESSKEKYVYDIPNLTPAQCNARAIAIWRQISMHEYQVTFSLPVTPKNYALLDVTTFFAISGNPYHFFNDTFWPRSIAHTFDQSGWHAEVNAVNHLLAEAAV